MNKVQLLIKRFQMPRKFNKKINKRANKTGARRSIPRGLSSAMVTTKGGEIKFWAANLTSTFTSVSTTPVGIDITNLIAQGLGVGQRIGCAIQPIAFSVRGTLLGGQANAVTDDTYNTVRILVMEIDSNFATLVGITVQSVLEPRTFAGLRHVLLDRIITLSTPGRDSTGYLPAVKNISYDLNLRYKPQYTYTGAAGSTINPTSLVMAMVTDSAAVANPGFTGGQWVFRYTDD
jgi:hypothetical protein